ncbi:hypothetical protein [Euzebya sp.]|uniref:hypothetical protein n=1 Tax=Euzebya sp. TaxID=1971409 RepID=UPI00351953E8
MVRVAVHPDDEVTARGYPTGVRDQLVGLGEGEALVSAAGTLRMTCGGLFLTTGAPIDPALAAFEVIAQVEGCTPAPTPTLADDTVRASRLELVRTHLGLETCCGDPSRPGSDVSIEAVRYADHDLAILAAPPGRGVLLGPGEEVAVADGTAVRGSSPEGPEDVRLACGDSDYVVQAVDPTDPDPPVEDLAAAVVDVLGCTPSATR